MLALWWFILLGPLLAWERLSADLVLNAIPGAPLATGVSVKAGGEWVVQAPARVAGQRRNIAVELPPRLPIQLTVAAPLFWAVLLAAGASRRLWRMLAIGTAILLAIPPAGLLAYVARVVQLYVYPDASSVLVALLSALDYVASTVAPFVAPVLLAVALHPELRVRILGAAPGR